MPLTDQIQLGLIWVICRQPWWQDVPVQVQQESVQHPRAGRTQRRGLHLEG